MKKFVSSTETQDWEVLTDDGYVTIDYIHKTIPYNVYELILENGLQIKCADKHILFDTHMNEVFLENLQVGDIIQTSIGLSKVKSINNHGYSVNMYDLELAKESTHRYYTNGILSHNTAVAKAIAETWYDGNLIRIDMSEYMEKISGTQFVGAPPGYVGYDSGGKLTEQVRRKPYSVVLLDEIEKAHPDVLNYLLQMLDDGHITDGKGHYVDFTNTMIIMTSNLGCREAGVAKSLGFGAKAYIMEDKSVEAAKKHFSPELWNRIDSQIVFETLTETDIEQIVEIELNKIRAILAETNIKLKVHKKVKEYLAKTGYSVEYGARFLERTVTNLLTDEIVDFILENDLKNFTISATMSKEGKIVLKDASTIAAV